MNASDILHHWTCDELSESVNVCYINKIETNLNNWRQVCRYSGQIDSGKGGTGRALIGSSVSVMYVLNDWWLTTEHMFEWMTEWMTEWMDVLINTLNWITNCFQYYMTFSVHAFVANLWSVVRLVANMM